MDLVIIHWLDACGGERRGWRPLKEIQDVHPAECRSVGFLIRETDTEVVICPNLATAGDDIDGDAEFAIPKSWVKKIRRLR